MIKRGKSQSFQICINPKPLEITDKSTYHLMIKQVTNSYVYVYISNPLLSLFQELEQVWSVDMWATQLQMGWISQCTLMIPSYHFMMHRCITTYNKFVVPWLNGLFQHQQNKLCRPIGIWKQNDVSNFDCILACWWWLIKECNNEVTNNKVDTIDPVTF